MVKNNGSSIGYAVTNPPPVTGNDAEYHAWILRELNKIKIAIDLLAKGHIDETHTEPLKPRNGDFAYADGANWNPSNGRGLYQFREGLSWVFIG